MHLRAGLPLREVRLGEMESRSHKKGQVQSPALESESCFGVPSSEKAWINQGEVRGHHCTGQGWRPCPPRGGCGTWFYSAWERACRKGDKEKDMDLNTAVLRYLTSQVFKTWLKKTLIILIWPSSCTCIRSRDLLRTLPESITLEYYEYSKAYLDYLVSWLHHTAAHTLPRCPFFLPR